MLSEPEYFYTIELPEKFGRMLEQLAADSNGLIEPESMAASLVCDALRMQPVLDRDDDLRARLWEAVLRSEKGENVETQDKPVVVPPKPEDDGLPWPGHREGPDDFEEPLEFD